MSQTELIARLEAGETGSKIDMEIAVRLDGWTKPRRHPGMLSPPDQPNICVAGWPLYSTSLDAAVALVERVKPGLFWAVAKEHPDFLREGEHLCSASVFGAVEWSSHEGYPEPHIPSSDARAPTPAAALLAALLRSMEQKP